jgi:hypothetical protein
MRAWLIAKAKRATDLSGKGAAIEGGRWNDQDIPAVYMGLTPGICCLETFVHACGEPTMPMKITSFELPDDASYVATIYCAAGSINSYYVYLSKLALSKLSSTFAPHHEALALT